MCLETCYNCLTDDYDRTSEELGESAKLPLVAKPPTVEPEFDRAEFVGRLDDLRNLFNAAKSA